MEKKNFATLLTLVFFFLTPVNFRHFNIICYLCRKKNLLLILYHSLKQTEKKSDTFFVNLRR